MTVMYICETGTNIGINEGQIVAETRTGMVITLPIEMLDNLVLFGHSHISTNCTVELLRRGISITYLSKTGKFYGKTESTRHVNIDRQRNQFRLGDNDDFCIGLTKRIISAKINNQKVELRRYNRYKKNVNVVRIIDQISRLEDKVENCQHIDEILGYEGNSSKNYFVALSYLINEDFRFQGRSKQPPRDPFNSMLSLGYTLLLYEVYAAIDMKGINPYAGFMHQDKQGHPTLASDMIEEWRAVVVDSLVMSLIQENIVKSDQFLADEETGGVMLSDNALRKFLLGFEEKMKTGTKYLDYSDQRMSYRRAIAFQVGVLSRAIDKMDYEIYRPLRIR